MIKAIKRAAALLLILLLPLCAVAQELPYLTIDNAEITSRIERESGFISSVSKYGYEPVTVELIAVGDNLMHMPLVNAGVNPDGSRDYSYMYEHISDELAASDVKIINQETVLVGSNYSGYPTFGSPFEVGEALIDVGFNVITAATNHSYDKGVNGILGTVEFWKNHDEATMVGMYSSWKDFNRVAVVETKGIKIAYLNYTYGLNGFSLPKDREYLVKTLYDEKRLAFDVQRACRNADIVVVLPHWGVEYTHKPTSEQRRLAQLFADNGADVIIGAHPHVVEPLEIVEAADGRSVPCFYSLGNFLSAQDSPAKNLGAMASVTIKRNGENVRVISAKMLPTVTHYDRPTKKFCAYMLEDYTDDLAARHNLSASGKNMKPNALWDLFDSISPTSEYTFE